MFIGHAALALASRSRAPGVSLGWLFAAAFGLDLLWPLFLLSGLEQVAIPAQGTGFARLTFVSYPWSHSLALALVWSAIAFGLARWRRCGRSVAFLIGALVFSHWVLDYVSHLPDLPLWPGRSPLVGLGLWRSTAATYLVEGFLYLLGIFLYYRSSRPRDAIGRYALPPLLGLMAALWAGTPLAPAPPSATAVAWSGLVPVSFLLWAGWADRHREPCTPSS